MKDWINRAVLQKLSIKLINFKFIQQNCLKSRFYMTSHKKDKPRTPFVSHYFNFFHPNCSLVTLAQTPQSMSSFTNVP